MSDNEKDGWQYIPVETADEIRSCGDVVQSKRLQNWNRWLKIRKQQHKNLGLRVCRSSTSLLMNGSDGLRSKIENQWMAGVTHKIKVNSEYKSDVPYSIAREINSFTSVCVPDVIRAEQGLRSEKRCARLDFGTLTTDNALIRDEVNALQSLIPHGSCGKLAIKGENILDKIERQKFGYRGPIPTIFVETCPEDESTGSDDDDALIVVRLNDFVTKSMNKSCKCETFELLNSKPINVIEVNEKHWDEIIVENRGQISFSYNWEKEEYVKTKYDFLLKERAECFYFDTRTNILGPGEMKRLPVLLNPKTIGPHREVWYFRAEILGRIDPIVKIQVPLQVCAITNIGNKTDMIELQNCILFEKNKVPHTKSTISVQSSFHGKYRYHEVKMKYLYDILQTERPVGVEELFDQCMRLERSFREKFLNLISGTAVTLLKREINVEHDLQMSRSEINATKTMYVAIDCIDLIMNTYEPDFDEAYREEQNRSKLTENAENISDYDVMREDFLEMIQPMIHNRLEWAIDEILDYDLRWSECKHKTNKKITNKNVPS